MHSRAVRSLIWRLNLILVAAGFSSTIALRAESVTLAWNTSGSPNIAGYILHYGIASRSYTDSLDVGTAGTGTISNLVAETTYYFAVTVRTDMGLESDFSEEITYTPSAGTNHPPRLDAIFIEAEAGNLTAPMTAVADASAWGGQGISSLVDGQGTASFGFNAPSAGSYRIWCRIKSDSSGTDSFFAQMDEGVEQEFHTVTDEGYSADWQWEPLRSWSEGDPWIFNLVPGPHTLTFRCRESRTGLDALFVTSDANFVPPASPPTMEGNEYPTLAPIDNLTLEENSEEQIITLGGITSGSFVESQPLSLSARSSNPALIPDPTIEYSSPNPTGTLRFTPVANASGVATIIVRINDGQLMNSSIERRFVVTVLEANERPVVNAGPDAVVILPEQLSLSGSITDDGLPIPPGRLVTSWSKVSGPGAVLFGASTSLVSKVRFWVPGYYVLRLTATDGESAASDELVVHVIDATGPVLFGVTLEILDARSFALRWQTDEPGHCEVEFGSSTGLEYLSPMEPSATTTHLAAFTNLTPATVYYYRIRSVDGTGNVSLTPIAPLTTPPVNIFAWAAEDGIVSAPMTYGDDDTALDGRYVFSPTANAGSIRFPINVRALSTYRLWCRVWAPSPAMASFAISVDDGPEDILDIPETKWRNGWTWMAVNGRNGFTPLALNPRTFLLHLGEHDFSFRALEGPVAIDELILSNDPEWNPAIEGPAPVLAATAIPTDRIRLTWTDALANEEGFSIQVSDGVDFVELARVPANTTSYEHIGLPSGSTHIYRVFAFNDSDRTDFSNVASASIGRPPTAPSQLTLLQPGNGPIYLQWADKSTDESGFVLERSADGQLFEAIQTLMADATSTVDPTLERGVLFYRLRAYNEWGSSAYSETTGIRAR